MEQPCSVQKESYTPACILSAQGYNDAHLACAKSSFVDCVINPDEAHSIHLQCAERPVHQAGGRIPQGVRRQSETIMTKELIRSPSCMLLQGGRDMNPADAFRKTQRQKEIARNKKERQFQRDASKLKADPVQIKNQLQAMSYLIK